MTANTLVKNIDMTILEPWVSSIILLVGMMIIIVRSSSDNTLGILSALGIFIVGTVYSAWVIFDPSSYIGIILCVLGAAILVAEARLSLGNGLLAIISLLLLFIGTYIAADKLGYGIWYPISQGLLIASMSAIAFLVSLPKNDLWTGMYDIINKKSVIVDTSVSSNTMVVDMAEGEISSMCVSETDPNDVIQEYNNRLNEIEAYTIPIIENKNEIDKQIMQYETKLSAMQNDNIIENSNDIETIKKQIDILKKQQNETKRFSDAAKIHLDEFYCDLLNASKSEINMDIKNRLNLLVERYRRLVSIDLEVIDELERRANAEIDMVDSFDALTSDISGMKNKIIDRKKRAAKALENMRNNVRNSSDQNTCESDNQDIEINRNI